ncbi:MAG TPA: post-COAP-1 domain-containing protein [Gemmatimonadaceae bacterium]
MQHRSHVQETRMAKGFALAIAAAFAVACGDTATRPPVSGIRAVDGQTSRWVGCNGGLRFTGGGRVDPGGVGKVTFGFNVDGTDACDSSGLAKGQMQVVYHETQTLVHTETMESFSSFTDSTRGVCGEFSGTARVKHVYAGIGWHDHHYFAQVCDKAEPGRGADRLTFTLDGERGLHENVMDEVLTGGNIQAHKS